MSETNEALPDAPRDGDGKKGKKPLVVKTGSAPRKEGSGDDQPVEQRPVKSKFTMPVVDDDQPPADGGDALDDEEDAGATKKPARTAAPAVKKRKDPEDEGEEPAGKRKSEDREGAMPPAGNADASGGLSTVLVVLLTVLVTAGVLGGGFALLMGMPWGIIVTGVVVIIALLGTILAFASADRVAKVMMPLLSLTILGLLAVILTETKFLLKKEAGDGQASADTEKGKAKRKGTTGKEGGGGTGGDQQPPAGKVEPEKEKLGPNKYRVDGYAEPLTIPPEQMAALGDKDTTDEVRVFLFVAFCRGQALPIQEDAWTSLIPQAKEVANSGSVKTELVTAARTKLLDDNKWAIDAGKIVPHASVTDNAAKIAKNEEIARWRGYVGRWTKLVK